MWRGLVAVALIGCQRPVTPEPSSAVGTRPIAPQREVPLLTIASAPSVAAPSPEAPVTLTPAQIAKRARNSVVVIETATGMGAGFVVGPGQVATCFHVVEGADRIVVRKRNGEQYSVASVIAYSPGDDVALLAVDGLVAPSLPLGDSTSVSAGDAVTVIGHPEGLESTVSTGIVSALRKFDSGVRVLQVTAPISPGSSGGPVLDQAGEVIGLTRARLREGEALNFATPVAALKSLFKLQVAPVPVAQFARESAKNKASDPLGLRPPSASTTASNLPTEVAGLSFGMTLPEAQLVCANADNQALAKRGAAWASALVVDGVSASCPFAPQPLEFVGGTSLKFAGGKLVRIGLTPTSLPQLRARLVVKYGNPARCVAGNKWQPWSPELERRAAQCSWTLSGGQLLLFTGKAAQVVYVSAAEDELSKQGI